MKAPVFRSLVNRIGRQWRAAAEVGRIAPFVGCGERILDIGAGGGWTGELLCEQKGARVTLLDVQDFNHSKLPLLLYDGRRMPFADNSFDAALLAFVLHHCQEPLQVLKEAARVSKRVIVLEDTFGSQLERAIACANDTITNLPSFLVSQRGMNLPFHFKRTSEWMRVFGQLGMSVAHAEGIRRFPTTQTLFVLEKT